MFLHGQPYEVIVEKTAKNAIALSNQRPIDLILLDARSQGEECFEICRRLKEREQTANTDSLSGLANNSYFKYFLSHEINRSLRDSRPLALVMMELNDVKHNPNHMGHPAGEELLKDLGTLIKENIRDVDPGARYKEQQFAMALINTDGNGAVIVVERLKDLIKSHFSKIAENISVESPTLDIGIAAYPSDAESMESLINHAAKVLSESKE